MELLLELLWLLPPEGVLPLKLGSFFPVAGPVDTYSLLLLLLLFELKLPGAVLLLVLVLPGVVPEEVLFPGTVLEFVLLLLLTFRAFPLLVVQAPFAAKV